MTTPKHDLPSYSALMYPVLCAVRDLGGSASGREITDRILETGAFTDAQVALTYPNRSKSILVDRLNWARSYLKLAGALDSPARKLYLLTALGHEILALSESDARARLRSLGEEVFRTSKERGQISVDIPADADTPPSDLHGFNEDEDDTSWTEELLGRLHRLSPDAFEEFCLFLLRRFDLQLTRRGGPGDEGIDGIGTAPISEVLSATVAVQVKRYDPTGTVGREVVALFRADATAAGAERAILITLGRFTAPARKAAISATPHVDLIDGERLCDLMLSKGVGVSLAPVVDLDWFDRFD